MVFSATRTFRNGAATSATRRAMLKSLLAGATIFFASTAFACTSASDDSPLPGDLAWVLPVTEGMTRLPDSCTEAVESAFRAIVAKPVSKIELIAYADRMGSASFALARVSRFAGELRDALLKKSPRMKIRMVTRFLPARSAGETPAIGRITLRVANRTPN